MVTTDEPPPLPIHTLSPCLFNPSSSISKSFMHVLLSPIFPSYNWPSSPSRTITFSHILLHKLFILLSLHLTKLSQTYFFLSIPLHHTSLNFHEFPCYVFNIFSFKTKSHTSIMEIQTTTCIIVAVSVSDDILKAR